MREDFTTPYTVAYSDLDALISALEIAVEQTNDTDHRILLLGALMARRNNTKRIEAEAKKVFAHTTIEDFR